MIAGSALLSLLVSGGNTVTKTFNQDQLNTATKAYLYFYPLISMEKTRVIMSLKDKTSKDDNYVINQFQHSRSFPDAQYKTVVRPNFDTLYSTAWLNLDQGPLILSFPAIKDRHFLLAIMDMYTDTIAVAGTGSVSEHAQEIIILPKNWQDEVPKNMKSIRATTENLWIIGRIQTNGKDDYENVHKLQDQIKLQPLTRKAYKAEPVSYTIDRVTATVSQVENLSADEYFKQAFELMRLHGVHASDWTFVEQMALAGMNEATIKDDSMSTLLKEAKSRALDLLNAYKNKSDYALKNGWKISLNGIGVYGNDYFSRAYIARGGLGAVPAEWAVYPVAMEDASGNPLNAVNNYILHFDADQLPPNRGFWSVTMYDTDGFAVANEINRFALGDRDGLHFNDDGSLTLYIQHDKPSDDKMSNWLPSPKSGEISLTMRIYAPGYQVLTGLWQPPKLHASA
ncbi:DUF1254 domain-containing protein [Cysteiniphilum litorale]|uniref:DUF1254 domain-containing protein n=1 Tax=Cysteiniphilum litorale TaxID=2056700 RepID=UPI003F8823C2